MAIIQKPTSNYIYLAVNSIKTPLSVIAYA